MGLARECNIRKLCRALKKRDQTLHLPRSKPSKYKGVLCDTQRNRETNSDPRYCSPEATGTTQSDSTGIFRDPNISSAPIAPLQKCCIRTNYFLAIKLHHRARQTIFAFSKRDTADIQYVEQGLNRLSRKKKTQTAGTCRWLIKGVTLISELHSKKGRKEELTVLWTKNRPHPRLMKQDPRI